jgi:hyperosmotically inducible periplasmic protein
MYRNGTVVVVMHATMVPNFRGHAIGLHPNLSFGGNIMRHLWKPALFAAILSAPLLFAEETAPKVDEPVNTSAGDNSGKADNTRRNNRERSEQEKTPVNQNENKGDLEISRQIRKAIYNDTTLSTYAHNIKIITQDGKVNLKGPVRNAEEKQKVEAKAAAVAGKENVKSQIELAPKEKE